MDSLLDGYLHFIFTVDFSLITFHLSFLLSKGPDCTKVAQYRAQCLRRVNRGRSEWLSRAETVMEKVLPRHRISAALCVKLPVQWSGITVAGGTENVVSCACPEG
ncbi:hypothetical protein VTI28DRAFT_9897 [Corynascus sepedonium]